MIHWLVQRIGQSIFVLWGILTVVFLLFSLLGDPVEALSGQKADAETIAAIRQEQGLDLPLWKQYLYWLNDASFVSWYNQAPVELTGISIGNLWLKLPWLRFAFSRKQSVNSLFWEFFPGTALLAVCSMSLSALVGLSIGLSSLFFRSSIWQYIVSFLTILATSLPAYLLALLLVSLFSLHWQWLPISGYWIVNRVLSEGVNYYPERLILPVLALSLKPIAIFTLLIQQQLQEVWRSDYIRTAHAKGLSRIRVLFKHALRNALIPFLTSFSSWLAAVITGSFFVEMIFDWQGIGMLTVDALLSNDYPLLMGCILWTAVIFLLISLLTDILLVWIDPRIIKSIRN